MIPKINSRNGRKPTDLDAGMPDTVELPSLLAMGAVVWRRKWLVALGLAIGLFIGSLYYTQSDRVYESSAQVLVVKKRPEAIVGSNVHLSHFEDYVNTHRTLIQSPLIIDRAVAQGNLAALSTFADDGQQLTEAVIEGLSVDPVSQTGQSSADSILALSFHGADPDECALVLNAILSSYQQFLAETYRDTSEDTVRLISEARDVLQKDLHAQEDAYRQFRQTSPLVWKGAEEINPRQERLTLIEEKRSALLLRKAELEANLATIQNAQKSGRSADEIITLASDLANKSERGAATDRNATLEGQLLPLLVEEQRLLQDLGPNHPHVRSVRKQIEATRTFFALPSATYNRLTERPTKTGTEASSPAELVRLYVQFLEEELTHLQKTDESLADVYEREHQAAREIANYEIRDQEFQRGIERTQALYDGIVKRLHDVAMVKQYGGFEARVIAPPGTGKKVLPNSMRVFPVAGMLGLVLGLVLVRSAELLDRRFRTAHEVSTQLGLPIFGHIPWFDTRQSSGVRATVNGRTLAAALCAYHRPRSTESEACRALRTALYFSTAAEQHRVIQITSPNPADGKTTISGNVAVSMAQSGKRVLLIDGEMRKPGLHRLFGTSGNVGLATVITKEVEIQDAVQETGVTNLWLLPCGPIPPDPAELLSSPRFSELISVVREQYDYVLIDTPPVLSVTDPCVVAARVDGVLMTLHIANSSRQDAQRATTILDTMGVNVLGVVVNAVPQGKGQNEYGYGYGHHGNPENGHGSAKLDRTQGMSTASEREEIVR